MVLMCGRPVWSDRMQDTVGFEDSERLGKCHTDVEPPPFARVPHPVDIETVLSHAVDAGEWRVELLATIVFYARPIALHEPISPRRPRAMDVDHVVPFRRLDLRQEARFQDVANEGLASGYDHRLLQFVGSLPPDQLARFRRWFTAFEAGRADHAKELDSTATKLGRFAGRAFAELKKTREA
jgi:hypothetical protein